MAKPELGTKRACLRCRTVFYDLCKPVPVCPRCHAEQGPALRVVPTPAPSAPPSPEEPHRPRFDRDQALRVLQFWRSCEFFASGRIDATRETGKNLLLPWGPGELPPWDPEHSCQPALPKLNEKQSRLYLVSFGLYAAPLLRSLALKALGQGLEEEPAPGHESALMAFAVDAAGRVLPESLALAMAPWAVSRTLDPGPGSREWLVGFEAAALEAQRRWLEAVKPHPLDGSPEADLADDFAALDELEASTAPLSTLSWSEMKRGLDEVARIFRLPPELPFSDEARVRPLTISKEKGREVEIDVLNSFYVGTLEAVAELVSDGDEGAALRQYLTPPDALDPSHRIDLRLGPGPPSGHRPPARWPSPGGRTLDASQQVALDALFEQLGEREGLFAVHGPPGTGKTTLLRDIVAAIVVRRAGAMARLEHPADAFVHANGLCQWRAPFLGHEIVVASSNNAALENITREIPLLSALDPAWQGEADYFRPFAERLERELLASQAPEGSPQRRIPAEPRAWGLVAAALGRSSNRKQFVDSVWWPDWKSSDRGERTRGLLTPRGGVAAEEGLRKQLEAWSRAPPHSMRSWREATHRFEEAERRESDLRKRQTESPNDTGKREWDDARAALFGEALRLHRTFIEANAGELLPMLQLAMNLLKGSVSNLTPPAARAAWTALFVLVPVVSTTFASFGRMFHRLGGERLGWLLIDEAGQATPQSAVGAIASSRRVLVMGDPQQLEPVIETPPILLEKLRLHHGASPEWTPGPVSVQHLADRTARYGTQIGERWVGAPLLIHRRCDEPMFGLANAIAYGNLMERGTEERPPLALPESGWIDVSGDVSGGHWIPRQGEALNALLKGLLRAGVDKDELFLISPYRSVALELRRRAQAVGFKYAGTIHTVQGKEADIVLFVLGGDRTKPRSRAFATARPNLVNVAITRARRRLYVLGDREVWGREPYFGELAARLPVLEVGQFG